MAIANTAKRIYESELQEILELEHRDEYVAIEPESKSHFLGLTFLDAAIAAKQASTFSRCTLVERFVLLRTTSSRCFR